MMRFWLYLAALKLTLTSTLVEIILYYSICATVIYDNMARLAGILQNLRIITLTCRKSDFIGVSGNQPVVLRGFSYPRNKFPLASDTKTFV